MSGFSNGPAAALGLSVRGRVEGGRSGPYGTREVTREGQGQGIRLLSLSWSPTPLLFSFLLLTFDFFPFSSYQMKVCE